MKAKICVLLTAALLATSAVAASKKNNRKVASASNSSLGITCSSAYRGAKDLDWSEANGDSGKWLLGDKSSATLKDVYTDKGPRVTLESVTQGGKDAFRIRVVYKGSELVNAVSVWTGLSVEFPVDVTADGDEDPPHFDFMRVSCHKDFLAG